MADSLSPPEVLACPHCDRLFHLTPEVLGKKIRCRGCRQVFHVPRDTTSVPLAASVASGQAAQAEPPIPVAIATVENGRDVRSCPTCGRMFGMKPALIGKTIRCRRCKVNFLVEATSPASSEPAAPASPAAQPQPVRHFHAPPPPSRPAAPRPMIFEDIGDLLEDLLPDEKEVASVVRPRSVPPPSHVAEKQPSALAAIGFCLACLVAVALIIVPRRNEPPVIPPGPGPIPLPPGVGGEPDPVVPPPKPNQTGMRPEDRARFETLLGDAHAALGREDFPAAVAAVGAAKRLAAADRDARHRADRWQLLTNYATAFPKHREQAFEEANKGREYDLDGVPFSTISVDAETVVYKMLGKKNTVARRDLDPGIEMAIMKKWFAGGTSPENHVLLGARWLCLEPLDRQRCEREWRTAESDKAEDLLPLLDDPIIKRRAP